MESRQRCSRRTPAPGFRATANSVEALGVGGTERAAWRSRGCRIAPRVGTSGASRLAGSPSCLKPTPPKRPVAGCTPGRPRPSAFMRCYRLRAAAAGAASRIVPGVTDARGRGAGRARAGTLSRTHQPGLARRRPAPPEGGAGRYRAPTPRSRSHQAGSSGTGSPSSMSMGREASHAHSCSEARMAQLSIHTLRSAG